MDIKNIKFCRHISGVFDIDGSFCEIVDQVMRCFIVWTRFGHVYNDAFGLEMGCHGSPRAHTLGKRSYGLQEGF